MMSDAKMNMLKDLRKMAGNMMGEDLKGKMDGMKKVTVAAPDEESLKAGLDKAKEVVEKDPMEMLEEDTGEDLDMDNEQGEPEAHKEAVMGDMSHDEIKKQIEELQKKLSALK